MSEEVWSKLFLCDECKREVILNKLTSNGLCRKCSKEELKRWNAVKRWGDTRDLLVEQRIDNNG